MKRKTSFIIGGMLLLVAVLFVGYGMGHPEAVFLKSLRASYLIYGAYFWLLFKFLLDIPFFKNMRNRKLTKRSRWINCIVYLFWAIAFFIIEVTGNKVDGYTIIRGFVIIGACDTAARHFGWLLKKTDREDEEQYLG